VQVRESCEGSVDLAFSTGLQNLELHSLRACCLLHVSDHGLAIPIVRVYEQGERPSLRNQLGKQFQPLGYQLNGKDTHAREVAAWPGETRDEPIPDRVGPGGKDNFSWYW
jgi:hypothetical protein